MHYFVSDIHLGAGNKAEQRRVESAFLDFLSKIEADAESLFLVGDIFDFWFEYKEVVPKGYVRVLGRLAELNDKGIRIVMLTGNHDMWVRNYFERECGMIVHYRGELVQHAGKTIMVAHGDNLRTEGQPMLKLMNALFRSNTARWLFRNLLHPDLSMRFGKWWSGKSRKSKAIKMEFRGEEEFLVQYAREWVDTGLPIDYYVFGHIHSAADYPLSECSRALFLGEWIEDPHYAVMDAEGNMKLIKL